MNCEAATIQARTGTAKCEGVLVKSVRDLRYRVSAVEDLLQSGEEIVVTKRKRVIARLLPPAPPRAPRRPDFLARLKKLYRGKPLKVSGADLLAEERERF